MSRTNEALVNRYMNAKDSIRRLRKHIKYLKGVIADLEQVNALQNRIIEKQKERLQR